MLSESSDGTCARNKDLKALDKEISTSTSRQQGSRGSKLWNMTEVDDTSCKQSVCGKGQGWRRRNIKRKWTDTEPYTKTIQRSVWMEKPSWAGLQQHRYPEHHHRMPSECSWQYDTMGDIISYSGGSLTSSSQSRFSAWPKHKSKSSIINLFLSKTRHGTFILLMNCINKCLIMKYEEFLKKLARE